MGTISKILHIPYQMYISIIALIQLIFIFKICKTYSPNPAFSLLLFFCFYYFVWTFSGLRQGLTLSIGIYCLLQFIEQKKSIKLIVVSILLSFIHLSALILIPLYYISRIEWKKAHLLIISIVTFCISLLPTTILASLISIFPFSYRIIPYLDNNGSIINFDFQTIGRIFFLSIAFLFYDKLSNNSVISKKILNIFILSISMYFLLKFSELSAARLSIYGKMLDILILPSIYYLINSKKGKMLYCLFISVLSLLYFGKELETMVNQVALIQNYDNIFVPYTNIFNKDNYSFDQIYYDLFK